MVERINPQGIKEYLLVHENQHKKKVYNQPAGHLDEGESLIQAAIRETLEETGWHVDITALIGIYRFIAPNNITYIRHAFSAKAIKHQPDLVLDEGIIETVWLSRQQITNNQDKLRSHMVLQTIDDYESGNHYPLTLFKMQ